MEDDKKKCEEADERGSHHSLDLQSQLSVQLNLSSSDLRLTVIQCIMEVDASVHFFARKKKLLLSYSPTWGNELGAIVKAYVYESGCYSKSCCFVHGREKCTHTRSETHTGTLKSWEHLLLYNQIELAITESKNQNKTSGAVSSWGYKSERWGAVRWWWWWWGGRGGVWKWAKVRFSRTVSLIGPLTFQGCQKGPEAMGEMGQSRGLQRAYRTPVNGGLELPGEGRWDTVVKWNAVFVKIIQLKRYTGVVCVLNLLAGNHPDKLRESSGNSWGELEVDGVWKKTLSCVAARIKKQKLKITTLPKPQWCMFGHRKYPK